MMTAPSCVDRFFNGSDDSSADHSFFLSTMSMMRKDHLEDSSLLEVTVPDMLES